MTKGFRFPDQRFSAAKANEASRLPGHLARLAARVKDEALPDFGAPIAKPAARDKAPSSAPKRESR